MMKNILKKIKLKTFRFLRKTIVDKPETEDTSSSFLYINQKQYTFLSLFKSANNKLFLFNN